MNNTNSTDILKQVFYNFIDSKEYAELGNLKEVDEVFEETLNIIKEKFGEDDISESEERLMNIAISNEMQGFIYGYQHAMRMIMACNIKTNILTENKIEVN